MTKTDTTSYPTSPIENLVKGGTKSPDIRVHTMDENVSVGSRDFREKLKADKPKKAKPETEA